MLLCHLLDKPRSFLMAWPEHALSEQQSADFQNLLKRRLRGEPLAHITGIREFWSLTLKVSADTLIPRPETELLVEKALERLAPSGRATLADLGTGSGAIALALASERSHARIDATDHSAAALEVARENAARLGIANIEFYLGNWYDALPAEHLYDLILSNPPYIARRDPHLRQGDLPHEPSTALVSGDDGLADIRLLTSQAGKHLKSTGWLMLEHGHDQGAAVRALLRTAGFSEIRTDRDLAGHERITQGRWH